MEAKTERWGQESLVTDHIADILRNYSDGTSVLYELVQNADDAGATEVRYMLYFCPM
jgi:sacsin